MQTSLQLQLDQIADGLADNGYAIIDHFLSDPEVVAIQQTDEFSNYKLHVKKAGIGKLHDKQVNEAIRGDYIQWVDPAVASPSIRLYIDRLGELISYVNQELFLSLKEAEVHMTVYPVGAYYKRHLDQFKADDHRKLSVICYLNTHWEEEYGGQLRIYLPVGSRDIFPIAGRLVCFRSDRIEHEVLPASRERLSLTGWIVDRPMH